MGRHTRPARTAHAPTVQARRRLAAGLASASALAATCLALTVAPAAPPAPDRVVPHSGTEPSDQPQPSRAPEVVQAARP
ncbi:hypothetical protein ACFV9W_08470 [Streptomyces sp. NPDC059897]|uniref:hypothetical protein n=1 Tax=Streptomyces sp. NPDC059897 TaxID=3346994 RepID=UPI00364D7CC9